VADGDDGLGLPADLVEGQPPSLFGDVLASEGAVEAGVDTEVATVERGERDDAWAVDAVLDLSRGLEDLLPEVLILDVEQGGGLVGVESFECQGARQDVADLLRLGAAPLGQERFDLIVGDEIPAAFEIAVDLILVNDAAHPLLDRSGIHGGRPSIGHAVGIETAKVLPRPGFVCTVIFP
jgi:hypothetical protein